jgi:hypothetical protein
MQPFAIFLVLLVGLYLLSRLVKRDDQSNDDLGDCWDDEEDC